jgi:methyl-accepting chemotaxis protein
MFGLLKRSHPDVVEAPPLAPSATVAPAEPAQPDPSPGQVALLQRWMSLAEMQQRVLRILAAEVTRTSNYVETEADALSGRFRGLATSAQQQTARVDSLTHLAGGVEVEGKTVPIVDIASLLASTLDSVVEKILMLSKDSMTMVYLLDEISANVENVRNCMARLDKINKTTNMLALNARIEVARAGEAGAAFRVVADEVRDLSGATHSLFTAMNTELNAVVEGVEGGKATLKRVATVDLSDNILAKTRLEELLGALVNRGSSLESIVASAVKEAGLISDDVDAMVTGIQFQDRTKQRLEHIVDTLSVIGGALDEIRHDTLVEAPGLVSGGEPDPEYVRQLLKGYTMSELRQRFVEQLIEGKAIDWPDKASPDQAASSGTIELF